ncbi:uncharacterized protein LOC124809457 [Hydra vulgaris]|uniref:uncharacterized protein LOC124809457 n=1 Tax=Hydra vulgaris TaxID=6087 RepID=UPI001F5E4627|nr:uncharacterized protein LOC124809457 [Hydra vulgaris]
MLIRKVGWERAMELEKKMHDEDKLLKKIPKINLFFTATNKVDATDNITFNSLPSSSTSQAGIDHKEEAAKIAFELGHTENFEGGADTGSETIPNDVGSFGDITDHSQLSGSGFKDLKNMTQYLKSHEISAKHIQSVLTLCQRSVAARRVDEQLHNNMLEQRNYWRNVLSRCVTTITFLCERGLPLRGSNEVVGSRENGIYLDILELIGQFDPFLSQHICTHGNRGRGHTSYLSKTFCEELIAMMGEQVMGFIKDEISKSRYFSVSLDSTPDITHCDQMTIILRYIIMVDYQLVEPSIHSWDVMMTHVQNQPECLVPKYPSDTRWSARAHAAKAVFKGYHQLQSALQEISGDCNQNGSTWNEAG